MEKNCLCFGLIIIGANGFFLFSEASWSFKATVKFSFASGHIDTSGNWIRDSLVRHQELIAIIHRDNIDSLIQMQMTDVNGNIFTQAEMCCLEYKIPYCRKVRLEGKNKTLQNCPVLICKIFSNAI